MIDEAIRLAHTHQGKYRVCALAYDRAGNLLAVGYNSYSKTHPLQARLAEKAKQPGRIYLHAEIAALVKAKASVYRLVVARVDRKGQPALAAPCPVCRLAIQEAGVEVLHYTEEAKRLGRTCGTR